jgi:uncharacterized membrane protein
MIAELAGIGILLVVVTVPGYFVTLALFPAAGKIDGLERLALSVVFSITALPLLSLVANQLLSIPITAATALAELLVIIAAGLIVYLARTGRVKAPRAFYRLFPEVPEREATGIVPARAAGKKR